MGGRGGQRKAEVRHENFLHGYTITVTGVIICAETLLPSLSDQASVSLLQLVALSA